MGHLFNPRHEQFARLVVELTLENHANPRDEAYKRCAYAPSAENARRLANSKPIKARLDELFAEAFEFLDVRIARVVARVDRVGRANLSDFFENDGKTLKNIKELPRELTDALASIEFDEEGHPKVKLADKNQANLALLKHLGGMPEPPPPPTQINIFQQLTIDDQRALAEALEADARRQIADRAEAPREHPEGRTEA